MIKITINVIKYPEKLFIACFPSFILLGKKVRKSIVFFVKRYSKILKEKIKYTNNKTV